MKLSVFFLLVLLLASLVAGGYYYIEDQHGKEKVALLEEKINDLEFRAESLENKNAQLSKELEEKVAKISAEKEAEIKQLNEAQNKLVEELKSEIEQKEIEITQLADRLSVQLADKILFPSGKANLTDAGLKVLGRVGNIIREVDDKIIRVEGHTDNVPIHPRLQEEFPSNWELSTARATNVVRFLQETVKVPPEKLEAVGLAEFYPVASNKTRAGRSKNRRIEIVLVPKDNVKAVAKK